MDTFGFVQGIATGLYEVLECPAPIGITEAAVYGLVADERILVGGHRLWSSLGILAIISYTNIASPYQSGARGFRSVWGMLGSPRWKVLVV